MSNVAKCLGERIKQMRNERKMSQEELSFKAGISAAHLGQIERAVKNPTVDTVGKIAAALGVAVASLFDDEHITQPTQNATVGKITAHLSAMTEAEQKDILRIIRILHSYRRIDGAAEID